MRNSRPPTTNLATSVFRTRSVVGLARRRGFTLIETTGVVILTGMLMSLCLATLHQAYSVHQRSLQTFREIEQLSRWGERFRRDTHQAVKVQADVDATFQRGDGALVSYTFASGTWVRQVELEGKLVARELWTGPALASVDWSVATGEQLPLVTCQLTFGAAQTNWETVQWSARHLGQRSSKIAGVGDAE